MTPEKHCPFCNQVIEQNEQVCPFCGAENKTPETIEELKAYCRLRGMPLPRMRFFIGEDYEKPKAFGICEDNGRCIVYKNKANGERVTRYSGPDEAYAVRELFQKLLDECHKRDIYPDGRPADEIPRSHTRTADSVSQAGRRMLKGKTAVLIVCAMCIIAIICIFSTFDWSSRSYENGYYTLNSSYYLKKGRQWYFGGFSNWYSRKGSPSENVVYLGNDYDPAWGVIEFEQSETGKNYQSGQYSDSYGSSDYDYSSDYSGWDSSDTDWNSDW